MSTVGIAALHGTHASGTKKNERVCLIRQEKFSLDTGKMSHQQDSFCPPRKTRKSQNKLLALKSQARAILPEKKK